eukprot:2578409-Rhodomonas_salina.2
MLPPRESICQRPPCSLSHDRSRLITVQASCQPCSVLRIMSAVLPTIGCVMRQGTETRGHGAHAFARGDGVMWGEV